MDKIKEWLNNRKIRAAWPKNMAVLYLLCIILPLLATDTIFFIMLINSGRSDVRYSYEKAAENMAFRFGNIIDNISSIALNITRNDEFEEFLEKDYDDEIEYYEAYRDVMSNKFLNALCSINSVTFEIYTDNPTIVNGGGIYSIESVRDREWYRDFVSSQKDVSVSFYFDRDTGPSTRPRRRLLYIKNMNYYPRSKYKKICRLVADYGEFSRNIENVATTANCYLCDDRYAYVFSHGNNNISEEFRPVHSVRTKVGYSRDFVYSDTRFYINVMEMSDSGLVTIRRNWPLFLIMLIVNAVLPVFFAMLTQAVQAGRLKEQEMDIARQQAELLALHSQINPHFLFNALESIRMHSVLRGEEETADMVEKLAIIERKNADWNEDVITIENEMEFADAYLRLQQYRFGDRLSYEIDVEESLKKSRIPKLSIVTFVENSCVHGVEGKSSPCWIFVRVGRKDDTVVIEIEDTGEGLSDDDAAQLLQKMENASIDALKQKGRIGVVNACLRLKIATENRVRFSVESEKGVGTTISVIIPEEYVK